MTVLAIDPSSTLTGWALMANSSKIIEAGLLRPGKTRDPAIKRIEAMTIALTKLLRDTLPDQVLIEMPSSRTAGRIKGRAVGNAIYGFAAGAMWWECHVWSDQIEAVDAELWTRGVPKLKRQQNICMMFPKRYNPETDRGCDIADAIGLACWWFSQQKAKRIVE